MNDEQYTPSLGTWLKDSDVAPPDPQSSARQIMAQLPESEKPRRWWPLRRRATPAPPPAIPSTEYQPTPIPASNGHTPTASVRTKSMFSPAKAITAGALVFALGGFLLIAQPFDQQESASVPGAATDGASTAMSRFTVTLSDDFGGIPPVSVTDEGLLLESTVQFGWIETTDARFGGYLVYTYDNLLVDEEPGTGEMGVSVHTMIVSNPGGRWIGTGTGIMGQRTMVLEGVDGYAGLTAVLYSGPEGESEHVIPEGESEGVIFPGDMPPNKDWCQLAREDFAAAASRMPDNEIGRVKDRTSRLCPSVEIP